MLHAIVKHLRQLITPLPPNSTAITIKDGKILHESELSCDHAQPKAAPPTEQPRCVDVPLAESAHPDQILLKDGRVILRDNIIRHDEQYGGWWHSVAGLTFFTPRSDVVAVQRGETITRIAEPTEAEIEEELNELASYNEPEPTEYHITPDDTPLEVIVEQFSAPQAESPEPAQAAQTVEKPEPRKALTPDEAELFHATAKRLCAERNRDGVWMGLLLHGVSVSNIAALKIIGKAHVEDENGRRIKIPAWLHNALNLISPDEWRRGRNIIHREMRKYEVTPTLLTTATHCEHGTATTLATS